MHILLSTDKNYIMPSAVMMKSVSVNNANEDVVFHVLVDDGVGSLQRHQLENVVCANPKHKVEFHKINGHFFDGFPRLGEVKSYITKATYYRLLIANILPDSIHKVIYLDGDIIVRHSLKPLYDTDINGFAVGAVTDMAEDKHDFNRLGYNRTYGYFNAGVLFINVDYWREHHLKEAFMDLIINEPQRIVLHDQDVLNITLHDKKLQLPMRYNVQNGFLWKPEYNQFGDKYHDYEKDLNDSISNPVILHFTDNKKPWHVEDCNPYGYEFMKYYKQTEWKYQELRHCNKSKIRYWGSKILRLLKLLSKARTYDKMYYNLEELEAMKLIKDN